MTTFTLRLNDDDREIANMLLEFEPGWLSDIVRGLMRERLSYRIDQQAKKFSKAVKAAVSGEDLDAFIEYTLGALGPLGIMGLLNNEPETLEILIRWRFQEWRKK